MNTQQTGAVLPVLPVLRKAWLREIGVDRRLLEAWPSLSPSADGPGDTPSSAVSEAVARTDVGRSASPPMEGAATVSAPVAAAPDHPTAGAPSATPSSRAGRPEAIVPRVVAAPDQQAPADVRRALDPASLAAADLAGLARHAGECEACGLSDVRGMSVFGAGCAQQPTWLVLGEAPTGEDERVGEPFQGKQGQLLQAMLRAGGLDPQSMYFTHLVKCRPLGNRPPSTEEIDACRALLLAQFVQVRPQRLLLLGRTAVHALLGAQAEFEQWQGRSGRWHWPASAGAAPQGWPAEGMPLLVTHHPGALLMRPQHKAQAWRDICRARQMMDR